MSALVTITLSAAICSAAEPYRDVVVIGGQRYLRTQQFPYDLPLGATDSAAVALHDGRAVYAAVYWDGEEAVFLRQFDEWGNPLHNRVAADQGYASYSYAAAFADYTWVLWRHGDSLDNMVLARVFDRTGRALGPPLLIKKGYPGGWFRGWFPHNLAAAYDLAVLVLTERKDGPLIQGDLHVQLFRPDGTPLTDLFPVATTLENEFGGWVAILPDRTLVMGYTSGDAVAADYRVYLRRIYLDGSVGPRVRITDVNCEGGYVRLLSDGTLLVHYRVRPTGTEAYVRRFSTDLLPVGDPVPVDPELKFMAADEDGSFAMVDRVGHVGEFTIAARLYDAQWRARTERFDPLAPVGPPYRDFVDTRVPLAYDDGNMCIAWNGHGGEWYRTSFVTTLKAFRPGDLNVDNVVNNFDIDPFVLALTNPEEYKKRFPGVPYDIIGDCNFDGQFNNFDIDPFVELLSKP